jgi:hypothetical protein
MSRRLELTRACYAAYESGDRQVVEDLLADDVGIDRETYFERCWPNSGTIRAYAFERLHEIGDEVFVTYEAERADGSRFRNTEVLTFAGDKLRAVEVYFGWDL